MLQEAIDAVDDAVAAAAVVDDVVDVVVVGPLALLHLPVVLVARRLQLPLLLPPAAPPLL